MEVKATRDVKTRHVTFEGRSYLVERREIEWSNTMTRVTYRVWEPADGHSTSTYIDGQDYGALGTRDLPKRIYNMPINQIRHTAVNAYHEYQERLAEAILLSVFPEAHRHLTGDNLAFGCVTAYEARMR